MTAKYVFIVDPFSSGSLYAEAIMARGLEPVAILSRDPILDIYKNSFKQEDFKYVFTLRHQLNDLLEELNLFLQNERPLFILPGTECGVELADQLTEYFCPELSNNTSLTLSRRDKFAMNRRVADAGIAAPLSIKSNSITEILSWVNANHLLSTGVVIKPLNSAGTDSVMACFSEDEIVSAFTRLLGTQNQFNLINDELLVQEFVSGKEYVVDSASFNGKHVVTNISCYKKISANGSNFVYDMLDFLPPEGALQKALAQYTLTVLDALGIRFGAAHSEIMLTDKGARLIETGARLHGGVGILASRFASQISQLEHVLDFYLQSNVINENKIHYDLINPTRIVFLISYAESQIYAEHPNIEKIRQLPSLSLMKLFKKPGDLLKKTVDMFTMPGILVLSHHSAKQLESDYATIRKLEKEGLFLLR